MSGLTRTTLSSLMRQAEAVLEKRGLAPPIINIGFANGGPGEPGPNEPRAPEDYVAWTNGGPLPITQEGLDWWVIAVRVMEEY